MKIDILKEPPLTIEKNEEIDKAFFYEQCNSNLRKIIGGNVKLPEKQKAARKIISLCRAAVSVFARNSDFESVQEVIDYYNSWSEFIHEVAHFGDDFDFLYMPAEEAEYLRKKILPTITRRSPLPEQIYVYRKAALHGDLNLKGLQEYYKRRS